MSLREFLSANREKLLLSPQQQDPAKEYYRLSSGVLQDKFISIWPLIENLELFEQLTSQTAKEVAEACADFRAQIVVGCTMTVRHLFEGLRPHLPRNIALEYLGNYPLLPLRGNNVSRLRNKRAIVLTDVMSTGQLVDDTVGFLADNDIEVSGVFGLVRAFHRQAEPRISDIACGRTVFTPSRVASRGTRQLPVRWCLDVHVDVRTRQEVPDTKSIPTDPLTIYPQAELTQDPFSSPLLEMDTEAARVEGNDELKIGYFSSGLDRFTLFFHTESLVRRNLSLVIKTIQSKFARFQAAGYLPPVLVTTPSKENREFMRAVLEAEDMRPHKVDYVLFSRTDDFDGSYSHILLGKDELIRGRPAIVLLSTIQSTETVRAISAVLSLHDCPDVSIFCGVNRTNPASASFLARVLRLRTQKSGTSSGIEHVPDSTRSDGHHFELTSLLRVPDLSASDLTRMENFVSAQFRRFRSRCGTETLRSLSYVDLKYFQAQPIEDMFDIEATGERTFASTDAQRRESISICRAAKVALTEREPDALIKQLRSNDLSKGGLFAVFRYLLADSTTLSSFPYRQQLWEAFDIALDDVKMEIKAALAASPDLENGQARDSLFRAVNKERQLLVGLALFSQFFPSTVPEDATGRASDPARHRVARLLGIFLEEPEELSTLARLYSMEWCYAIAFAALLLGVRGIARQDGEEEEEEEEKENRLRDQLHFIKEQANAKSGDLIDHLPPNAVLARLLPEEIATDETRDAQVRRPLVARISSIIDALVPDPIPNTGGCLAALVDELCIPRPQHTFCAIMLGTVPPRLQSNYDTHCPEGGKFSFMNREVATDFIPDLNNLLFASTKLEALAGFAERILKATPQSGLWTGYFLRRSSPDLLAEVRELTQTVQLARTTQELTNTDIEVISRLSASVSRKLWGRHRLHAPASEAESAFFNYLIHFRCGLLGILEEAIVKGCSRIGGYRNVKVSGTAIRRVWKDVNPETFVLCDPSLLLRAFENYVANFRHARVFENCEKDQVPDVIGAVSARLTEDDQHIVVEFKSQGEGPEKAVDTHTTLNTFRESLSEFGCTVNPFNDPEGNYVIQITVPVTPWSGALGDA